MTTPIDSIGPAGAPYIRIECERFVGPEGSPCVKFVATDLRNGECEVMQVSATESELMGDHARFLAIAFAIGSKIRLDDYHDHDLETPRPAGWRNQLRRKIDEAIERASQ